ncbi:MAG: hypothetical protein WC308_00220 [archaeon]|jgi:hypothetical protein
MDLVEMFVSVPRGSIINFSILVIAFSFVIIAVAIIIYLFKNRKSDEEKHIETVLDKVAMMKSGKIFEKNEKASSGLSNSDVSIKEMLVKKFKPKLESQIGSKVNVIDLKAVDNSKNFIARVEISGVKLSIILDGSGKIIDYKKEK